MTWLKIKWEQALTLCWFLCLSVLALRQLTNFGGRGLRGTVDNGNVLTCQLTVPLWWVERRGKKASEVEKLRRVSNRGHVQLWNITLVLVSFQLDMTEMLTMLKALPFAVKHQIWSWSKNNLGMNLFVTPGKAFIVYLAHLNSLVVKHCFCAHASALCSISRGCHLSNCISVNMPQNWSCTGLFS